VKLSKLVEFRPSDSRELTRLLPQGSLPYSRFPPPWNPFHSFRKVTSARKSLTIPFSRRSTSPPLHTRFPPAPSSSSRPLRSWRYPASRETYGPEAPPLGGSFSFNSSFPVSAFREISKIPLAKRAFCEYSPPFESAIPLPQYCFVYRFQSSWKLSVLHYNRPLCESDAHLLQWMAKKTSSR